MSVTYYKLQAEQVESIKNAVIKALKDFHTDNADEWIPLEDAFKMLPYRSKTKWQELRDRGDVLFSKMGRKILYSKKSLLDYIEKNQIK